MELYIVTECNRGDNLLLRSWVCFTKEQADECLKTRYQIACAFNELKGIKHPVDCLYSGFFFWEMGDGQELRYQIVKTQTFAE